MPILSPPHTAKRYGFLALALSLALLLLAAPACRAHGDDDDDNDDDDHHPRNGRTRDLCVIGGGAAGSAAAVYAADRNKNVVVLERQSNLGGQCDTLSFPGGWNEAGVGIYPNTTRANELGCGPWTIDMVAYVKRFAGQNSLVPTFFTGLRTFLADYTPGTFLGSAPVPPPPTPSYLATYARYLALMSTTYGWMDTLTSTPDPIPAELRVSLDQWIVDNNFTEIYETFVFSLYTAGFGDFDSLTAFDGLLQRGCTSTLYGVPDVWFSVDGGCQKVYDGIADYLGPDSLRFRTTIEEVVRPRNPTRRNPIIVRGRQTLDNGHTRPFVERCRKLVVTVPPTLDNLSFMDLTYAERHLFRNVSTRFYYTGRVNITGGIANPPGDFFLINVNVSDSRRLASFPTANVIFRRFGEGPAVVQAFSSVPTTVEAISAVVQQQLDSMTAGGAFASATDLRLWAHPYNPHWSREALGWSPSPYNLWDDLQGVRGTIYLGSGRYTPNSMGIINIAEVVLGDYL